MPDLTEILVSIQESGPGGVHVAAGLLGDKDLVLVPDPPGALLDRGRVFDVVVIPVPLDAGSPVERLPASCHNVLWARKVSDRPVAAVLKLSAFSAHQPSMGPFDALGLASRLDDNGGDLWLALEDLGSVRPGLRDGPPADILAALPEVERRQREPNHRDHDHDTLGDIGFSICKWLCICRPE